MTQPWLGAAVFALSATALSQPAHALAFYAASAAAFFGAEFDGDIDFDTSVSVDAETVVLGGTGDAFPIGTLQQEGFGGVGTSTNVGGNAQPPGGSSLSVSETSATISFFNAGAVDETLFVFYDLSAGVSATAGDPLTEASSADALASILADVDGVAVFEVSYDLQALSGGLTGDEDDESSFFEVTLAPGQTLTAVLTADATGTAEVVGDTPPPNGVIPLPAAAPLMLLGLGAFGAVRRFGRRG